MALLQIAEPGQSPVPHQVKLAVGIDLGTTNSLVATVRGGRAAVLPDEQGAPMLPSVVNYSDPSAAVVGRTAQAMSSEHPADTLIKSPPERAAGAHPARPDTLCDHIRPTTTSPRPAAPPRPPPLPLGRRPPSTGHASCMGRRIRPTRTCGP